MRLERAADRAGEGAGHDRFRDAGHVFEQHVAFAKPGDEHLDDLLPLADDDLLDVRDDPPADRGDIDRGSRFFGHGCLFRGQDEAPNLQFSLTRG